MRQHLKYLIQACKELDLDYYFKDQNKNLIEVLKQDKRLNFINSTTPFNSEAVARICKDKSFCYQLLHKFIDSPLTIDFLDPHSAVEYLKYTKTNSYQETAEQICKSFNFPIIVKPNTKTQGINVFKCENFQEVLNAVITIFNQKSADYDYILLAQEYINIDTEYRVIVFRGNILFSYLKDISNAIFDGNLSPLHWKNSKAIIIKDDDFSNKLQDFINPIFTQLDLIFGGLDIVLNKDGQFKLIEVNTQPGFDKFLESNDPVHLIEMYKMLLSTY